MKRFTAIILAAILLLTLVSCKGAADVEDTKAAETTEDVPELIVTTAETEPIEKAPEGTVPEGFTETELGLLSPDFAPASVDMNRSLRLRIKIVDGDLTFVAEIKDMSPQNQRLNLTESKLTLSKKGESVALAGGAAINEEKGDYFVCYVEYDADESALEKLEALTAADEISVCFEGVNSIQDVSSPYRDQAQGITCNVVLSEDDIAIIRDAISLVK